MQEVISVQEVIKIDGCGLDHKAVWEVAVNKIKVEICSKALERVADSRNYIEKRIDANETMYGVNTGFGHFSDVAISNEQLKELQKNLIRSHCCGIGTPFSTTEVRAIMLLRANALLCGHSGIRPVVIEALVQFINHDVTPYIPSQGSVGASGDLAPLAHLALSLMGEGSVLDDDGHGHGDGSW